MEGFWKAAAIMILTVILGAAVGKTENDLATVLKEKGMNFTYTHAATAWIAKKSFSAKFGARNMRRLIQREVEDRLAEHIIADTKHAVTQIRLSVSEGNLVLDCL